jgi:hypothetical protein
MKQMQITDNKLLDLYRRFINFVSSNYPDAIITENKLSVMINYPGELARIFLYQDKPNKTLLVKIAKDITIKMSDTNGRLYYLSSIDELNSLKSGIQVIMDLKMPELVKTEEVESKSIATIAENNGQGYLLDDKKNILGVVYLNLIPTNAFVYSNDQINVKPVDLNENSAIPETSKTERRNSLSKFFKR